MVLVENLTIHSVKNRIHFLEVDMKQHRKFSFLLFSLLPHFFTLLKERGALSEKCDKSRKKFFSVSEM